MSNVRVRLDQITTRGRALDGVCLSPVWAFHVPNSLHVSEDGYYWRLRFDLHAVTYLRTHSGDLFDWQRFPSTGFHAYLGNHEEYRSHQDRFGPGSVHLSINPETGEASLDWDEHCPEDLVGLIGHGEEVFRNDGIPLIKRIGGWFKRLVARRPPANPSPAKNIVDIERERRGSF